MLGIDAAEVSSHRSHRCLAAGPAPNQRRQELIGKHRLRVVRVEGVVYAVRVRQKIREWATAATEITRRSPVGGKAGI